MKPRTGPKIAYLVSQYPAVNHTFILREIRGLRSLGFDIRVASIRAADRPRDRLTRDEQEELNNTYYVKPRGAAAICAAVAATAFTKPAAFARGVAFALRCARFDLRKCVFHLIYLAQAVAVARWMRREGLTHLHTHFSSTVALFLNRTFGIPYSATIHGSDEFIDPFGFLLPEKIAAASFVCAISSYGKSQLARFSSPVHWGKLIVAPLGVDLSVFSPRPFRAISDTLEILCVGSLAPPKAQQILIGAVQRLHQNGRKAHLRLAGRGPDREQLESEVRRRGIGDHVTFEGAVNQDRVRELYAATDVFALASFAEGVPVVLMEAMAMEIPCVATWVTGVPELIRTEIDGLLVAPADEEGLACAIARLADDDELRERLGKAGRRRVLEKYNINTNIRLLGDIFEARLVSLSRASDATNAAGYGIAHTRE